MCFTVAAGVWVFRRGCFELQILWIKSKASFLQIYQKVDTENSDLGLRNGESFVTLAGGSWSSRVRETLGLSGTKAAAQCAPLRGLWGLDLCLS